MSGRLEWRPIVDGWESAPGGESCSLKNAMADICDLSTEDLSFLAGVCAAGVPGAEGLIDIVHKYKAIELRITY